MAEKQNDLKLIRMNEVEATEISWLWYPYIPFGKITIIQGDPGDGKTTAVLAIAAAEPMREAGFISFERGERGSTAEHLSVLEYKTQQESEKKLLTPWDPKYFPPLTRSNRNTPHFLPRRKSSIRATVRLGKWWKICSLQKKHRPAFALFTICSGAGKSAAIGSLLLAFPACKKRSRRNTQQRRRRLTDGRESERLTGFGAEPQQAERSHSDRRKGWA